MANRLARESSPYLLLHAENPVDWYPWGEEAFERARARGQADLPLGRLLHLLLVPRDGAGVLLRSRRSPRELNEAFVCVKVDREERPDLDEIYMTATQLMTRSGGWPNSVFLTPDLKPFFARHLLPAARRRGPSRLPARAAERPRRAWVLRRAEVLQQAEARRRGDARALARRAAAPTRCPSATSPATAARRSPQRFDPEWGGFGARAEVPLARRTSSSCSSARSGGRRGARDARHDPRPHGARRHLRPARRWLPPLLDRRAVAGAALREDAVRQRGARLALRRGRRRSRPAEGFERVARDDPRLRAARDDAAATAASSRRSTPRPTATRAPTTPGRATSSTRPSPGPTASCSWRRLRLRRPAELRGRRATCCTCRGRSRRSRADRRLAEAELLRAPRAAAGARSSRPRGRASGP